MKKELKKHWKKALSIALIVNLVMGMNVLPSYASAAEQVSVQNGVRASAETCGEMSLDTAYPVSFGANGSWVGKFTAPEGGAYFFLSEGKDDTCGTLYGDEELTEELYFVDDGGSGLNFRIPYFLEEGQSVYLKVKETRNSSASCQVQVIRRNEKDLRLASISLAEDTFELSEIPNSLEAKIYDFNGNKLQENVDYVLEKIEDAGGSAPKDYGTAIPQAVGSYRAIYKGNGDYVNRISASFSIIDLSDIGGTEYYNSAFDKTGVIYTDGSAITLPELWIYDSFHRNYLRENVDFQFSHFENTSRKKISAPSKAGTYYAVYEALGKYKGIRAVEVHVESVYQLADAEISLESTDYFYTGKAVALKSHVKDAMGVELKLNTDYVLVYHTPDGKALSSAPKDSGDYYVTAKAKTGSKYTGETVQKAEFRIGKAFPKVTAIKLDTPATVSLQVGEQSVSSFTASEAGLYRFEASSSSDSYGILYSDAGLTKKLTSDDDSGEESNYKIEYLMKAGQTVYLLTKEFRLGAITCTVKVSKVDPKDLGNAKLLIDDDHIQIKGGLIFPQITVKDCDGNILTEETDYVLSYENPDANASVDTGDLQVGWYRVFAKAKDGSGYKGESEREKIYLFPENDLSIGTIEVRDEGYKTGESLTELMTVKDASGKTLTLGTDYQLAFSNIYDPLKLDYDIPDQAGVYKVVAQALSDDYTGSLVSYFTLYDRYDLTNNYRLELKGYDCLSHGIAYYTYTGEEIKPELEVLWQNSEDDVLEKENYTVSYENNVGPTGKGLMGEVKITPEGSYHGSLTARFKIVEKLDLSKVITDENVTVTTVGNVNSMYSGSSIPQIRLADWSSTPEVDISTGGSKLVQGTDFTVTYIDSTGKELPGAPTTVGRYQMVIKGTDTGKCTGVCRIRFALVETKSDSTKQVDLSKGTITTTSAACTGKVQKPAVKSLLVNGIPLVEGRDYKITVEGVCKDVGTYNCTVTGIGSYKGSIKTTFKIVKGTSKITLKAQSKTFTGKALKYSGKVTKSGSAGKVTYTYYSDAKGKKTVKAANVKKAGTYYVRATVAADKNFKGATSNLVKFTITKAKNTARITKKTATVKKATVAKKAVVVKPLTVTKAKGKVSYALVSASKNKSYFKVSATTGKIKLKKGLKKGTYTVKVRVKVTGNANYKALTKTVAVKIVVKY